LIERQGKQELSRICGAVISGLSPVMTERFEAGSIATRQMNEFRHNMQRPGGAAMI
jgi:hypothetical protein